MRLREAEYELEKANLMLNFSKGHMYDDEKIPDFDEESEVKARQEQARGVSTTPLATTPNLCVKVKAFYNTWFKDYVAKNPNLGPSPEEVIKKIVEKANKIYKYPGLGNTITIVLVGIQYDSSPEAKWEVDPYGRSWLADSSIQSKGTDPAIDHNAFFTRDQTPHRETSVGIAYVGTVCFKGSLSKIILFWPR